MKQNDAKGRLLDHDLLLSSSGGSPILTKIMAPRETISSLVSDRDQETPSTPLLIDRGALVGVGD
jgi:hypothetical protein